MLGDTSGILIPELPRSREGAGRLRGLRFLHTHLGPDLLSQEDCMDLLFLRFDSIAVISVDEWGEPLQFQYAHLLPPNPEKRTYMLYPPQRWDAVNPEDLYDVAALEEELARTDTDLAPVRGQSAAPYAGDRAGLAHARRTGHDEGKGPASRAVLVSVSTKTRSEQESALAELAELADSAGIYVTGTIVQRVQNLNPRFIMGKGKLAELEVLALQGNAGLVVFDGELSPAQLRNLTDITERRVIDRTQLILDIFAQRASSRAGKFQVELAQLEYMLPRLVGKSRAMDRLLGGIGGRGPGETKLETDRRRLRERVSMIRDQLKKLRRQRSFVRARRAKGGVPVASLVGYTNAGKSTLLNVLTGSEVPAENRLFATLDPTTRRLRLPCEQEIVLADTVGFIRSLPKELVEAFRATLEELEEADLLLHVADASHPELEQQVKAVDDTLARLEMHETPRLLVLNKVDALPGDPVEELGLTRRQLLEELYPAARFISARTGEGLRELAGAIAKAIK